jgi:hypothetical protein
MKPVEKVASWVRRPAAYFAREWNRMAPRERRLAGILGGWWWWASWWGWRC